MKKTWLQKSAVCLLAVSMIGLQGCADDDDNRSGTGANNNGRPRAQQRVVDRDSGNARGLNLGNAYDRTDQPGGRGNDGDNADTVVLPFNVEQGKRMVDLRALSDLLEYSTVYEENGKTAMIGEEDPLYQITVGSRTAKKEEDTVHLYDAPVLMNGKMYVSVQDAVDLFGEDMNYELRSDGLALHPNLGYTGVDRAGIGDNAADGAGGGNNTTGNGTDNGGTDIFGADDNNGSGRNGPGILGGDNDGPRLFGQDNDGDNNARNNNGADGGGRNAGDMTKAGAEDDNDDLMPYFSDDPNDPAKGTAPAFAPGSQMSAKPAVKDIDMNALIARGRRYMGVPYKFGAGPYPRTGRFDCSSYTQYLYGKFGVTLPRVARNQATQGTAVSRNRLRVGDMMFFYVPGRFRTNRTVGHVGIYMGNRRMIHSSPAGGRGVQISSIDNAYYQRTFLRARRVAY